MISITQSAKTKAIRVNGRGVTADAVIQATRELMVCTRRQARLALGPEACAIIDAAAEDENLPWAMRESIRSATEWYRTAPEIDELAWLLGLTGDQIDALFHKAMSM